MEIQNIINMINNPEIIKARKEFSNKWDKRKIKKNERDQYRKDADYLQKLMQIHI